MCIQYKIQVRSQKKLKVHNKWKKKIPQNHFYAADANQ